MSITSVECFQVRWAGQTDYGGVSAWVRITDDRGEVGYGEVSPMDGGLVPLTLVQQHLRPMLLGRDPFDCAVLQEEMFHRHVKLGPDGVLSCSLAGIDIALWDLRGKLARQPVYKLLGGAWRTSIPFYASVGGPNNTRSVAEVVAAVEKRLVDRPALVKLRLESDRTRRDVDLDGDIAKARAVRELVGDGFPLAFDANNGYSVNGAIRVGRVLEELGYRWFEEPLQHYHIRTTGEVARHLDIAVSAGEQTYTLAGFADLISAGVRIVQPDIIKMGGFTGLLQVQALAQAHGCDVIPHQTQPTIGNAANLHFVASQLHGWAPAELNDPSRRQNSAFKTLPVMADGRFELTDAPGLGVTVDEDALRGRIVRLPGD
jgi:D-galactarolactone cycloisomerase